MLEGANESGGFLARARRTPQRYRNIAITGMGSAALAKKTRFLCA
jgi:hypothetical protein